MSFGFDQKVVHGATNGCRKEELSRIGVKEFNGLRAVLGLFHKLGLALKVSREFGVVALQR